MCAGSEEEEEEMFAGSEEEEEMCAGSEEEEWGMDVGR